MASDCGRGCKDSRTTYSLEVERECDYQIVDPDVKGVGQRTDWKWRGSVMVSDLWTRMQIKWSKTTYKLNVERVRDCVRL